MINITAISDTHGQSFAHLIKPCDILIHCGDISPTSDHSLERQETWTEGVFFKELQKCPANHIIFIGGNHDFYLESIMRNGKEDYFKELLPRNVHYLRDEEITIEGIKFYGTPWCPKLRNWAFYDDNNDDKFSGMPDDVDILISHSPAYGFCDKILDNPYESKAGQSLGSRGLTIKIAEKQPKHVFSGHIHSGNHNQEVFHNFKGSHEIKFRCVSLLGEDYQMAYNPYSFFINNTLK